MGKTPVARCGLFAFCLFLSVTSAIPSSSWNTLSVSSSFNPIAEESKPLISVDTVLKEIFTLEEVLSSLFPEQNQRINFRHISYEKMELKETLLHRYLVTIKSDDHVKIRLLIEVPLSAEGESYLLKKHGWIRNHQYLRIFPEEGVLKKIEGISVLFYPYSEMVSYSDLNRIEQRGNVGYVIITWLSIARLFFDLEHYVYALPKFEPADYFFIKRGRKLKRPALIFDFYLGEKVSITKFMTAYFRLFIKEMPHDQPTLFILFNFVLLSFGNEEGMRFLARAHEVFEEEKEVRYLSGIEFVIYQELGRFIRKAAPKYLSLQSVHSVIERSL